MSSKLPTRQLGKDGPQVTALGFGAMGLSAFYGPTAPDEERLKFLDYVYAQGERFWDSSDIYGDSEELIGKWVSRDYSCLSNDSPCDVSPRRYWKALTISFPGGFRKLESGKISF